MSDPKIVAALSELKLEKAALAPLPDLSVLRFTGADAEAFLQSQLTQDVAALPAGHAALAGYCTAKGRLLATGVLLRSAGQDAEPGFDWIVRADLAATLQKRLTMFVLRSKVKIALLEGAVHGLLEPADAPSSGLPSAPWALASTALGLAIRAPSVAAFDRYWLIGARPDAEETVPVPAYFELLDCLVGLPWVSAATQDLFIPQTLNLELIGGVSFSKGCYPGQEIVARSHYRGLVKRRASLGVIEQALPDAAGQDLFLPEQTSAASRIIQAAVVADRTWVLWEATKDTLAAPGLRAGAPDGPVLHPLALPYSLNLQGAES
ncbi:MAG: folate-binding protein [Pigmentiphaga sp.]|nr:folate-binding protein [Pigmentiphaga sp.]